MTPPQLLHPSRAQILSLYRSILRKSQKSLKYTPYDTFRHRLRQEFIATRRVLRMEDEMQRERTIDKLWRAGLKFEEDLGGII